MQTQPGPWIEALRHSHERLSKLVGPLDTEELQRPSYASEWSIAQVLSHLGSQAEIFDLFLDAGLSGDEPPRGDAFSPIWDVWNARNPEAQAAEALRADLATLERFESLEDEQRAHLQLEMFGMSLDTTGLARMRLGEHAVHTWDVAVALDRSATVSSDAVDLLVDSLGQLVSRVGKPDGTKRRVRIVTSAPERHFDLEVAEAVTLTESAADRAEAELRIPAEGFVRLIYGRLDPDHTPPIEAHGIGLDELRQMFVGV